MQKKILAAYQALWEIGGIRETLCGGTIKLMAKRRSINICLGKENSVQISRALREETMEVQLH